MPATWREEVTASWPRSRAGNRQPIGDVGQEILDVALFVRRRLQRNRAGLAVAGDEAAAGRAHAAPFGAVDRHRIEDAERGRQHFGANALARALHMAARAGEIHLAAAGVGIAHAVLCSRARAGILWGACV